MKRTILGIMLLAALWQGQAQDFLSKGKLALTNRDTAAAVQAFEAALRTGQKPAEGNFYLGAIAFAQHRMTDAVGYLQASVRADDDNVDALILYSSALLQTKDAATSLTALRRAVKIAPKNPNVSAAFGMALLAADSVNAAIIQLTRAQEALPTNADIPAALGDAYLKQNVVVLAISKYQKAKELAPKNIDVRWKLATAFEKNRQYAEAVAEYEGITQIDSTYADAYLNMGKIFIRATNQQQKRQAVAPLKRYSELRPKSAEGAALYAKALFLAEDFEQAAPAADQALKLDPQSVELLRIAAHSRVELKEYDKANQAFEGLRKLNAIKPEDQMKLGLALQGLGRADDALKALLEAIRLDSTNCDPYFPAGFIYMSKKDYASAAAMFERKITCDPRSLSAYLNGAACYMQTKNYGRARELLLKLIELKPDFLQGRLWLGRYYAQVDSLEKAKEQYDQVLQTIGSNTDKYRKEAGEAQSMTGSYYFSTQRYDRAAESFRKAQAFGYDNAGMQMSWGQALLQTLDTKGEKADNDRKKEEAIKHFRRVIELESGNAVGHLWLAQTLVMSREEGNTELNQKLAAEACSEYRKVLKLDPRNNDAKKGMERIGCQ